MVPLPRTLHRGPRHVGFAVSPLHCLQALDVLPGVVTPGMVQGVWSQEKIRPPQSLRAESAGLQEQEVLHRFTLYGIVCWREQRRSPRGTYMATCTSAQSTKGEICYCVAERTQGMHVDGSQNQYWPKNQP